MLSKIPRLTNILKGTLLESNKAINRVDELIRRPNKILRKLEHTGFNPKIATAPIKAQAKSRGGLPYISSEPNTTSLRNIQATGNVKEPAVVVSDKAIHEGMQGLTKKDHIPDDVSVKYSEGVNIPNKLNLEYTGFNPKIDLTPIEAQAKYRGGGLPYISSEPDTTSLKNNQITDTINQNMKKPAVATKDKAIQEGMQELTKNEHVPEDIAVNYSEGIAGRGAEGREKTGEVNRETDGVIGASKTTTVLWNELLQSKSSQVWGELSDGTNQGIKHFADYWELYSERIPSIAERLGVDPAKFAKTAEGFENFTNEALRITRTEGVQMKEIGDKKIYFMNGAENAKKGVVVIMKEGKLQTMMPSELRSFLKME